MTPLDAREWLQVERLEGNPFALELLDLVEDAEDAEERMGIFEEISDRVPADVREAAKKPGQLYRIDEWIRDRLALLEEIEEILDKQEFESGNGTPYSDPAEKLRDMLCSPRWQQYDL